MPLLFSLTMLNHVKAVTFVRSMKSGRNAPCILECERAGGEIVEVIAKFSAAACGCNGLVAEALAAMIAVKTDIPVPEPFLVDISDDFIDSIPYADVKDVVQKSSRVAFGLKKLPPQFSVIPLNHIPTAEMAGKASEIFTFDACILNFDRRQDNPNCLTDGNEYAVIDHELALNKSGLFGWVAPWEEGGELDPGFKIHIFEKTKSREKSCVEKFTSHLGKISESFLGEVAQNLPADWIKSFDSADMVNHLLLTRRNAEGIRLNFTKLCL